MSEAQSLQDALEQISNRLNYAQSAAALLGCFGKIDTDIQIPLWVIGGMGQRLNEDLCKVLAMTEGLNDFIESELNARLQHRIDELKK